MLPSLSLPLLEFCFGTSPTQAEKSRPDRKALGSAMLATRAVASARHQDLKTIYWTKARLQKLLQSVGSTKREEHFAKAIAALTTWPEMDLERVLELAV